jgi:hypothetical protein
MYGPFPISTLLRDTASPQNAFNMHGTFTTFPYLIPSYLRSSSLHLSARLQLFVMAVVAVMQPAAAKLPPVVGMLDTLRC